jgi:peroxiredoxin
MSLQEKLDAFTAELRASGAIPRNVLETLAQATGDLVASGAADGALKAGQLAPDFVLKDANGSVVESARLLVSGPLVVTFYRGVWCSYCNIDLKALEAMRGAIEARGALLVAISMQNAPNSRRTARENGLGFPILVDKHGNVANAFGVRFKLPVDVVKIYREVLKQDLEAFNNDRSWALPMPSRFVIGQDGVVAYAEVNPDYTRRPDPCELFPVLDQLARAKDRSARSDRLANS